MKRLAVDSVVPAHLTGWAEPLVEGPDSDASDAEDERLDAVAEAELEGADEVRRARPAVASMRSCGSACLKDKFFDAARSQIRSGGLKPRSSDTPPV